MSEDFNIEKVLPFLFCSQCGNHFDINCAKILVTGNDTVIVKVTCKDCGKKYALAFMDLTFPLFAQSYGNTNDNLKDLEFEDFEKDCSLGQSESPYCFEEEYEKDNMGNIIGHIQAKNLGKITYDDVLEAHDFIQNFEENWRRYIDKRKFKTV